MTYIDLEMEDIFPASYIDNNRYNEGITSSDGTYLLGVLADDDKDDDAQDNNSEEEKAYQQSTVLPLLVAPIIHEGPSSEEYGDNENLLLAASILLREDDGDNNENRNDDDVEPLTVYSTIERCQSTDSFDSCPTLKNEADEDMSEIGILPTEFDVLCGQSRTYASHSGNCRFQQMLEEYVSPYSNESTSKHQKMSLTKEIVARIAMEGGRFLKLKEDGFWEEISTVRARDKVGHALRTKVATASKKRRNSTGRIDNSSGNSCCNHNKQPRRRTSIKKATKKKH